MLGAQCAQKTRGGLTKQRNAGLEFISPDDAVGRVCGCCRVPRTCAKDQLTLLASSAAI